MKAPFQKNKTFGPFLILGKASAFVLCAFALFSCQNQLVEKSSHRTITTDSGTASASPSLSSGNADPSATAVTTAPSVSPSVSSTLSPTPLASPSSSVSPSASMSPSPSAFASLAPGNDTSAPVAGGNGLITASNISPTSFTLQWAAAADDTSNTAALQYCVYSSAASNLTTAIDIEGNGTPVTSCSFNLTTVDVVELQPATTYYFNIIVKDAAGNFGLYSLKSQSTASDSLAPVPGNSGVLATSNTSAIVTTLNWVKGSDTYTSEGNLQYLVYYSTSNNISTVANMEANGTPNGSFVTNIANSNVLGLIPSTTYYFNLMLRDGAGNKAAYQVVSATTSADSVSPTPGNAGGLTLGNFTLGGTTIHWTAGTDNIVNHAALRYEVRQSTTNNMASVAAAETNGSIAGAYTANITSWAVSGLTLRTRYFFTVIVKDTAGNKSIYGTIYFTPSARELVASADSSATCVISYDSSLRCFGNGGQLGYNDTVNRGDTPGSISGLAAIDLGTNRVAAGVGVGNGHTCAILDTGAVKCWGSNNNGQLGYDDNLSRGVATGSTSMSTVPTVNLGSGRTAKAVSLGSSYSCALLDTDQIKCWGYNGQGQLGLDDQSLRGNTAGNMAALPTVNLGSGRSAKALNVGGATTCAILDTDQLKCWGGNNGKLGQGLSTSWGINSGAASMTALSPINFGSGRSVKQVSSGSSHVCGIFDDDSVKCWGYALGMDDAENRGSTGGTTSLTTLPSINLGAGRTAKAIAAGRSSTCVILDTNAVKCWGFGLDGALGYDDLKDRGGDATTGSMSLVPTVNLGSGRTASRIVAGLYHSCVLLDNDAIRCWGRNSDGELGQEHPHGIGVAAAPLSATPPVSLGAGVIPQDIFSGSIGDSMCIVLQTTHSLRCWGSSFAGYDDNISRGTSSTYPTANIPNINLGSGRSAKMVSTSGSTCAVLDDNTLKCWGYNDYGQLGYDDTNNRGDAPGTYEMANVPIVNLGSGRTAKKVAVANASACALLDNDQVKCWGSGSYIGTDDTTNRGDTSITYGMANLPAINLGASRTAKDIAGSTYHSCAILDNNSLKCWGYNSQGQLGQDDALTRGNSSGASSMANLNPINLGSGRTAKAVGTGEYFTCALLDNNTVKCWGNNAHGELGFSDFAARGNGSGTYSMANIPALNFGSGRTVEQIAVGYRNACAILDNHSVKCWGSDYFIGGLTGQDTWNHFVGGDSGPMALSTLPPVGLGTGRTATKIAMAMTGSCALLDNNSVKCWGGSGGYDDYGLRGIGWPMEMGIEVPIP